jgi:hypothetical protein
VGYVLEQVAPKHLHEIPKEGDQLRPRAFKYYNFFADRPNGGAGGWRGIPRLADSRRGDVLAWRLAVHPERHEDTGHVVIVAAEPWDDRDGVWAVRVYDSSPDPHFDDSRGQGGESPDAGVGTGTIRFRVDDQGKPIEFLFGPSSATFLTHPIAIGRVEPLIP